jgi:3',5'-cyclic-nucleotide phosphodiesterase
MGILLLIERPTDRSSGPGQVFRVLPDGRQEESSLFPLAAETTRLGRSDRAGVGVLLACFLVNRQHALIRRCPDGFYLEDLHSRNGTTLNGTRLLPDAPRKLEPGDRIEIAGYVFEFRDVTGVPG